MRIRPVHAAVAVLVAVGAVTSVTAADAATGVESTADRSVSRFVAFQTCQAAMWRWTAENARIGTSVSAFRHRYRAEDVWREHGHWHVQAAGRHGEVASPNNDAAFCEVGGSNARPKIVDYAYPR